MGPMGVVLFMKFRILLNGFTSWNFLEQKLKAASFEGLKRLVIYEYLAVAYGCTWKNTQGSQGPKLALFRTKV